MKSALISLAVFVIGIVVVFNTPTSWFSWQHWFGGQRYGSFAYTSLNNTDTIANFPSLWNTTFSNVSANLFSLADWYATTSATQLVKVGTLTTGTWNASTVTVPYGGTGSTTLAQYQVLLGSSTNGVWAVPGTGSSGQLLTSNGPGTWPTWQSASFNTTLDYTVSGFWKFTYGLFSTIASSTNATTTNQWVTSLTAGSLVKSDSNKQLQSAVAGTDYAIHYSYATSTAITAGNGSTVFAATTTIPAGVLTASSTGLIGGSYTCDATAAAGSRTCTFTITINGTTIISFSSSPAAGHSRSGNFTITMFNNSSLSAQGGILTGVDVDSSSNTSAVIGGFISSSINTANALNISMNMAVSGGTSVTGTLNGFTSSFNQ